MPHWEGSSSVGSRYSCLEMRSAYSFVRVSQRYEELYKAARRNALSIGAGDANDREREGGDILPVLFLHEVIYTRHQAETPRPNIQPSATIPRTVYPIRKELRNNRPSRHKQPRKSQHNQPPDMSHETPRLKILNEMIQRSKKLKSKRRAVEQPIRTKQRRNPKAHAREESQDIA